MTRLRIMTPPGRAAPEGTRLRLSRPARRRCAGLAVACGLAMLGVGCGTSAGGASRASPGAAASTGVGQSASASPPAAATGSATVLSPATRKALAAKYLAIAEPANHSLDVANDGYSDAEHDDLANARQDLLDEVATETRFDSQLLAIRFPAPIEQEVQALVSANKIRIQLTQRQARATTLASIRVRDSQHKAADAAVEAPVRQVRRLLGLPPPSTS